MSRANAELKKIAREFNQKFNFYSEESYNEKLLSLKPGESAPIKGQLTGSYRKAMEDFAAECRRKTADIMDRELTEVNKKLTEAPSNDAINSIALFNMRNPQALNEGMVRTLLDKYGSNPQSYEAILDIAAQKGIRLDFNGSAHPLREQQANIEALGKSLSKAFTVRNAEDRHSTGFNSFIEMTIDQTFAPDPE